MTKEDKIWLIERLNPSWNNIYYNLGGDDEYEFYDKLVNKYVKKIHKHNSFEVNILEKNNPR